MKKRFTLLTLVVVCIASIAIGVAANGIISEIKAQLRPDFTVEVDGQVKTFKNATGDIVYPVLYEGTTYLPLRAIGELMGKTVYWYEDEKRIELRNEKQPTVTDADVIVSGGTSDFKVQQPVEKSTDPPAPEPPSVGNNLIGSDDAKAAALQKAGLTEADVIFVKVELDEDNGRLHYDVEFHKGLVEYEAEINAVSGEIYSWEVDTDN